MCDASDEELWDALPEKLQSYAHKLGLVKSGRWFSLNEQGAAQMKEFTASRMILEWYLQLEEGPDDVAQRNLDFSRLGGLKLAYMAHSWRTFENLSIVLNVQQPLWDFYSDTLHFVKSPDEGLQRTISLLEEGWNKHWTLRGISQIMMSQELWHGVVQWSDNPDGFAKRALSYATEVMARRCASLSKLSSPPEWYAGLLSPEVGKQAEGLQRLQSDFKLLLKLESADVATGETLAADLRLTHDCCVRFVCCVFEASGWQPQCEAGLRFLRVLLCNFADSKVVEDSRQRLRDATGSKANKQLNGLTVQQVLQDAQVLEERGISHPASISKEKLVSLWRRTKTSFRGQKEFPASQHKLPADYSKVIAQKTWQTISEQSLVTSAAGWAWFRHYCANNLGNQNVKPQVGCLLDVLLRKACPYHICHVTCALHLLFGSFVLHAGWALGHVWSLWTGDCGEGL